MMFPDHELFVPKIDPNTGPPEMYQIDYPDATLGITNSVGSGLGSGLTGAFDAARGRVTRQDADQVIIAQRIDDPGFGNVATFMIVDRDGVNNLPDGYSMAPHADGFSDFLAVAAGDLDKVADQNGENHDEIVVAFASPPENSAYRIRVDVLNFNNSDPEDPFVTCAVRREASNGIDSLTGITPSDTILDVSIADFNGDGMNEVAVAFLQNQTTLVVTTFTYHYDGNQTCTLTENTPTLYSAGEFRFIGSLQVDVGNIDGDALADMVVAYGTIDEQNAQYPSAAVFSGTTDPGLQLKFASSRDFDFQATSPVLRVQVATGLFQYDPSAGQDFARRQVLFGWVSGNETISVQGLAWDDTVQNLVPLGDPAAFSPYLTDARWSIAAGSLRGLLAGPMLEPTVQAADYPPDPRWSAIFYGIHSRQNNLGSYLMFDVTAPQGQVRQDVETITAQVVHMPLVAFDADGNSLFLGSPVHITINDVISTNFILYEPPKHVFYNIKAGEWGDIGEIVNLSGYPEFNVSLKNEQGESISSKHTQTSNGSFGVSEKASAKATFNEDIGVPDIAQWKNEQQFGVKQKFSYNYKHQSADTNSSFSQRTVSYTDATSADDEVGYNVQDLNIWRYRIYGTLPQDSNAGSYGYYEFIVPAKQSQQYDLAGSQISWYQPLHENDNILSYPLINTPAFPPADVGDGASVVISGTTYGGMLASPRVLDCCIDATPEKLQFEAEFKNQNSLTTSHNVNGSLDFSASYTSGFSFAEGGYTTEYKGDVAFSGGYSWSNAQTDTTTSKLSKTITLNKPSVGRGNNAYEFAPAMYVTQDGSIKVAHGVSLENAGEFWDDYYGSQPDPALNLPKRFNVSFPANHDPVWSPEELDDRKEIRGFYLIDGDPNPITNAPRVLPSRTVIAGEPLKLSVNIYNYSTGGITNQHTGSTDVKNLQVLFEYIPLTKSNTPCKNCLPVKIGTVTVPNVPAMQIAPAQIAWDTNGLGGSGDCNMRDYRIIVTLDPDNKISNEIYESENPNGDYTVVVDDVGGKHSEILHGIDPGQNNQGYAHVTVQSNTHCGDSANADTLLKEKALGGTDALSGKLRTDAVDAFLGRALPLRIQVHADKAHDLFGHVFIYDGNPRRGGKLIADQMVHFGNPDGATVWFHWVPQVLGKHVLYAQVRSLRNDPHKKNGRDILTVNVIPEVKTRE